MGFAAALAEVAQRYRVFAQQEARGRSAAYESLAQSVAGDGEILKFIASLPPPKRQPQLVFATARYLLGLPALGAVWVCSEGPRTIPGLSPVRAGESDLRQSLIARDAVPIAVADTHGAWLRWLA